MYNILLAVLVFAVSLLGCIPFWLIWNAVMPDVFGLPTLTFWQAALLFALCRFAFPSPSSSSSSSD